MAPPFLEILNTVLRRKALLPCSHDLERVIGAPLWLTGGWIRAFALGNHTYHGDFDFVVESVPTDEISRTLKAAGVQFSRTRLGGFRFHFNNLSLDLFSTRWFDRPVTIRAGFKYFNATVNAAAFRLNNIDSFVAHKQFHSDISDRQLRLLPLGFERLSAQDQGKSLTSTLKLLASDRLSISSTSRGSFLRILHNCGTQELLRKLTKVAANLEKAQQFEQAAVLRRWLQ